jgi:hypothetical protein
MSLEELVSPTALIDSGSRFQCIHDCGFCCGFWDISIDKQRKHRLLQLGWVQAVEHDLTARKNQSLFPILGQMDRSIIQREQGTALRSSPMQSAGTTPQTDLASTMTGLRSTPTATSIAHRAAEVCS